MPTSCETTGPVHRDLTTKSCLDIIAFKVALRFLYRSRSLFKDSRYSENSRFQFLAFSYATNTQLSSVSPRLPEGVQGRGRRKRITLTPSTPCSLSTRAWHEDCHCARLIRSSIRWTRVLGVTPRSPRGVRRPLSPVYRAKAVVAPCNADERCGGNSISCSVDAAAPAGSMCLRATGWCRVRRRAATDRSTALGSCIVTLPAGCMCSTVADCDDGNVCTVVVCGL
jgi:hypothetical protein